MCKKAASPLSRAVAKSERSGWDIRAYPVDGVEEFGGLDLAERLHSLVGLDREEFSDHLLGLFVLDRLGEEEVVVVHPDLIDLERVIQVLSER